MDFLSALVGTLPEPRLEAIIKCDQLLRGMNITSHEDSVAALIGTEEHDAGIDFAEAVEYMVYDTVYKVIAMHSIRLNDNVKGLRELMYILEGLVSMSDILNEDTVVQGLELYQESNDIICYILSEITGNDMVYYLEKIDYVDIDLINRLREGINEHEYNEDREILTSEIVDSYKKYMEGKEFGIIASALTSVQYLPISFNVTVVEQQDNLKVLPPEYLVEELYQLAILSNTLPSFEESVTKVLIAYGKDPEFVASANKAVVDKLDVDKDY